MVVSPVTISALRHVGIKANAEYLLVAENIRKEFPGVVALDNVQFKLKAGSVHALMGENGAGKSTLMKILAGIYRPDQGTVKFKGVPIRLESPLDALENGIAMIHQELALMPYMTVAENIWIRREPVNMFGLVNHRQMYQQTAALFEQLHIDISPSVEIRHLTVAEKQMVEIAKAISYNSDVLIMDEPTSALTDREVEHLFQIINRQKANGVGIVYITHKMDELYQIADEFSIFRDGHYISTHAAKDVSRDEIIQMMVGREISQMFPKAEVDIGDVIFSVKDLCLEGAFSNVSFDVRAGEILGVAGLVGSGRSNVAETIFGVTPATSGEILIKNEAVTIKDPNDAIGHQMAFLTEDRKETGCFLLLDVLENMQMAVINHKYVKQGFVQEGTLSKLCDEMRQKLRIKTPGLNERIENLSGGNQQKVLIGRWLLTNPDILILDEPTRGIDVGAKAEIYKLIGELAQRGVAVIMISSELPEVLGISDRIMVMHQGKVTGFLDRAEATQVAVMNLAAL
ncbi:sugar ABC transporter ATP-binding protein [Bartonella sp. HY329]|uniref:sugar ABC transporter ATP-binding protein n=1 Tax=unclassified Bartonella TaxID=2645622 RepID=UPI0021C5AD19|nr:MULTISPECIES: sugar ABC transporter ATP-binding protein [unclassified Bartonella]UXM94412.1 sugar ABC transporter ATP-binding protein [Bartonella sp. HY329]UXN08736.1 sugar ABC transporter ATP-binding protein [Bartonella sp. HY328]